ncbi:hypothetical protein BMS3Bbin09_00591 [bacterium BMS3Bbin09]|nr:hypothetical protein BMS3Bbin09_00591 [bacterium BMS3Bbin09]
MPILAAPTGPSNGMSEILSAAETPMIPSRSDIFSSPKDRTETIPWVSQKKPSGKSGLMGLSIRRDVNVSFSLGLPSLLKNPPGILPAA